MDFASVGLRQVTPGPEAESDGALDEFIRSHSDTDYHPCGTCKMGAPGDPEAVRTQQGPDQEPSCSAAAILLSYFGFLLRAMEPIGLFL